MKNIPFSLELEFSNSKKDFFVQKRGPSYIIENLMSSHIDSYYEYVLEGMSLGAGGSGGLYSEGSVTTTIIPVRGLEFYERGLINPTQMQRFQGIVSSDTSLPVRETMHQRHVREHQEQAWERTRMRGIQEMERRQAQSEADRIRAEEERTRERRPWERVRSFFGRD